MCHLLAKIITTICPCIPNVLYHDHKNHQATHTLKKLIQSIPRIPHFYYLPTVSLLLVFQWKFYMHFSSLLPILSSIIRSNSESFTIQVSPHPGCKGPPHMKHHYPEHRQTVLWLSQHHFGLSCSFPSSQMLLHCSCLPVEPSPHISLPDLYHLAVKGSHVEITPCNQNAVF